MLFRSSTLKRVLCTCSGFISSRATHRGGQKPDQLRTHLTQSIHTRPLFEGQRLNKVPRRVRAAQQSLASALSLTQVRCERMCQLSDTPSVRSPQLRTSSTADFTMSLIEGSSLETSLSLGRTSSLFHCPPVCNFYHKFGNIVLNLISRDEEIAVNSIIATER